MKTQTIKLSRAIDMDKSEVGKAVYRYKVLQVTDSLIYHVNEFIDTDQAEQLCASERWKVTIV